MTSFHVETRSTRAGFTLVELLIVIAIIGVLVGLRVAEGMPAGSYVVTVRPPPSDVAPPLVGPDPLVAYPNIPKKYWSDTTSTLTATVGPDQREPLRFDLEP